MWERFIKQTIFSELNELNKDNSQNDNKQTISLLNFLKVFFIFSGS